MDVIGKKMIVLSTQPDAVFEGVQLLKENGFDVEVREPRKRDWLLQTTKGLSIKELKHKRLADKTCKFLISNLNKKFSLDDIAHRMGTNRSQLSASFKRAMGVGVFEWLRTQRLLKAKSLLKQSNLSVLEIAFEVGYENQANFSSAYKKHFCMSPKQHRHIVDIEKITQSKGIDTQSKVFF